MGKEAEKSSRTSRKVGSKKRVISEKERHELFDKHVVPHFGLIKKICVDYTNNSADVDDNFQGCLINFFTYVHTYNPEKSILTWIHICAKRHTIELEKKISKNKCDCVEPEKMHNTFIDSGPPKEFTEADYKDTLSDECIEALDSLQPIYKNTFLMKVMGYKLREIMDSEFKNGNLKHKNIETVKSRLFLARRHLQKHLSEFYDKY